MIHLLHAPIAPRAFMAWSASRSAAASNAGDDGPALHILLSAIFGKGMLQPFRLFKPAKGDWSLYAYTDQPLEALRTLAEAVAPPEMLAILPMEKFRAKPMPSAFPANTRLGFDLRARPVRRGAHEQDAFLWEALNQHALDEKGMSEAGRTREAVYRDWLAERLGTAATLETCRLTAFQRLRVWRGAGRLEGPDATLQGTLMIQDSDDFLHLLSRGIGRHRAYGYGMLMLRPPDRNPLDH